MSWPQRGIYQGNDRQAATFDGLSVFEFMHGYIDILNRKATGEATKAVMLTHLQELMEDGESFSWEVVRSYHGVLLREIENGRVTWADDKAIQKLRGRYVHRHNILADTKTAAPKAAEAKLCDKYQKGECEFDTDHDSVKHKCATCKKNKNKLFDHPTDHCWAKNRGRNKTKDKMDG